MAVDKPVTLKGCNSLHIEYVNSQSLLCHLDEIKLYIVNNQLDILCVSETWLAPNLEDRFVNVPGYSVFRHDRGRGSGVCVYVKQYLTACELNVNVPKSTEVEDVWITVQCRKLPSIIVGCIYRHPHALVSSFEYLSDIFKDISLRKKPFFIFGDLNDNMLAPNTKISQIIKNLNLSQMINKPTRITATTESLIDVLITNKPEMIIHSDVLPSFIADHELITTVLNIDKPKRKPEYRTFRSLRNYNQESLCNTLLDQTSTLNDILLTDDINTQTEILTKALNKCVDLCAPVTTQLIRRPPAPWISDDIKKSIKDRDTLQKQLKLDRSNVMVQEKYKDQKKLVKSNIHKAKALHFKKRFQECGNSSSKKWRIMKDLVPDRKKNSKTINFNDTNTKVEEFNDFFANVGRKTYEKTQERLTDLNVDSFTDVTTGANIDSFRPSPVTVETVILTFKQLHDTNAIGSDGLAYRFVRDSLLVTVFYLTVIVNTSIVTGLYPALWKQALISPNFKSGDTNDVSNFRPISLLSILSKILEKIIANQLKDFLENNNLLSECQHGFRANLSTETALLKVTDKIYNNIDNNKITLLVLCDLSKAFDSVHHDTLLKKMVAHNIDTYWFSDYLHNRTQSVKIENHVSSVRQVSFGVPQGSILGPILFLIFVNDMSKLAIQCDLVQYADDSQFIFTGSVDDIDQMIENAEQTLKEAKRYFDKNGLMINTRKTQIVFIGSRQNIAKIPDDTKITFDGNFITPSNFVKTLGVTIDRYMTFDEHINDMHKKTMGTLIFINRIKDKLDRDTRVLLVEALALSLLNYCCKIWGSAGKTQIQRVQKLQNFAAKIASGKGRKYDRATPYITELNWLKIDKKCSYDACIFIYKILHKHIPDWLVSIETVGNARHRFTRQCNDIFIRRASTNTGKRQFNIRGPLLWNTLPTDIREGGSLGAFKNRLRDHYLSP